MSSGYVVYLLILISVDISLSKVYTITRLRYSSLGEVLITVSDEGTQTTVLKLILPSGELSRSSTNASTTGTSQLDSGFVPTAELSPEFDRDTNGQIIVAFRGATVQATLSPNDPKTYFSSRSLETVYLVYQLASTTDLFIKTGSGCGATEQKFLSIGGTLCDQKVVMINEDYMVATIQVGTLTECRSTNSTRSVFLAYGSSGVTVLGSSAEQFLVRKDASQTQVNPTLRWASYQVNSNSQKIVTVKDVTKFGSSTTRAFVYSDQQIEKAVTGTTPTNCSQCSSQCPDCGCPTDEESSEAEAAVFFTVQMERELTDSTIIKRLKLNDENFNTLEDSNLEIVARSADGMNVGLKLIGLDQEDMDDYVATFLAFVKSDDNESVFISAKLGKLPAETPATKVPTSPSRPSTPGSSPSTSTNPPGVPVDEKAAVPAYIWALLTIIAILFTFCLFVEGYQPGIPI